MNVFVSEKAEVEIDREEAGMVLLFFKEYLAILTKRAKAKDYSAYSEKWTEKDEEKLHELEKKLGDPKGNNQ